ncbi:hypothetical protein AB1Y20_004375 [Prymnesium parvum]|uniref:F-box domain-containing protein n=1 Tax=Prymnesium parvum TaxID=97485 RepID=A0AB34IY98_PRYPA
MASLASSLPEDALLLVLQSVPQLGGLGFPRGDWAACAAVCSRWRALVRAHRTRLRLHLPRDPRLAPPLLRAAVRELSCSRLPLAELSLSLSSLSLSLSSAAALPADVQAELSRLAARSAALESLVLRAADGVARPPSDALSPLVAAVGAEERAALCRVDVSWGDACSAKALGAVLRAAPRLAALRLAGCSRVADARVMAALRARGERLVELGLAACSALDEEGVIQICAACPHLTDLDISRLPISRRALEAILHVPVDDGTEGPLGRPRSSLQRLAICGYTQLSSHALARPLVLLPNLCAYNVAGSLFADMSIDSLAHELAALTSQEAGEAEHEAPCTLRCLGDVNLTECSALTDRGVVSLCRMARSSLHTLRLGGPFSPLADPTVAEIASLKALRHLELTRLATGRVTQPSFQLLSRAASGLELLDLSHSQDLSAAALRCLLSRAGPGCGARLRTLRLRGCARAVTDDVLCSFLPRAHSLASLDVAFCTELTVNAAVAIAAPFSARAVMRRVPSLKACAACGLLDVTGCSKLSERGIRQLRTLEEGEALRVLGLDLTEVNYLNSSMHTQSTSREAEHSANLPPIGLLQLG